MGLVRQGMDAPGIAIPKVDKELKAKLTEILWCLNQSKILMPPAEAAWFVYRSRQETLENHRPYIESVYVAYQIKDIYWKRPRPERKKWTGETPPH